MKLQVKCSQVKPWAMTRNLQAKDKFLIWQNFKVWFKNLKAKFLYKNISLSPYFFSLSIAKIFTSSDNSSRLIIELFLFFIKA